jgi:hypothetical protein
MDEVVNTVMVLARTRMDRAPSTPAWPITKLARMNMITPRMVRMAGVNTPPNVPKRFFAELCSVVSGICSHYKLLKSIVLSAELQERRYFLNMK